MSAWLVRIVDRGEPSTIRLFAAAESGKLAGPACPKTFSESFIAGTEPTQACEIHR